MTKIDLTGKWDVVGTSPEGEKIELTGTVPGSTLNDIIENQGVDPFYRDNAETYQKYERYSWVFKKTFNIEKLGAQMNLFFERLDTFCDIYLNETHISYCDNGNIAHSFDVTKIAKIGENELIINFYSPVNMTLGKKPSAAAFCSDRIYVRRPQCTHGWDWAQRFVTMGISRDAYLEIREIPKEVKTTYVYTKELEEECAIIGAEIEFFQENTKKVYDFYVQDKDGNIIKHIPKYCNESFVKLDICIEDAKLWWPFDYGEQNLYDFVVKRDGETLYTTEFGIRKAVVIEIADKKDSDSYKKCLALSETEQGKVYDFNRDYSSFTLKINSKKILCKGMNWVPCQPFPMGNTDKKITEILEMAKENGVNMLRVWGGAAFETEHFYDECSRLGIMVTQDFLMACAKYPEDEKWFIDSLKKEAEYAADLIRNKACLMWWSGDNENAVYGSDIDEDYSGRRSMYEALAPVMYKRDPHRRIFASSPYGGIKYASNVKGTTHNTQFLDVIFRYIENSENMKNYKEFLKTFNARFIAEEPCFGAVDIDSLKKFMDNEDIFSDDQTMWYYHTKNNPGLEKELYYYFTTFAEKLMGKFKSPEDRFFKFKYLQYEYVRISLERVRRELWFCSGIVFWMLNDCWPAASGWAFIDYYNKPKSGLYAFKKLTKPIAVSLDFLDNKYSLYISNTGATQKANVKLFSVSGDKAELILERAVEAKAECAYSAQTIELDLKPNQVLIGEVTTEDGETARCFYRTGDLVIEPIENGVEIVEKTRDSVTLKAKEYIHVVELGGNLTVEDNYFNMMPGEIRRVAFKEDRDITVKCYSFVK